MATTEQKMLAYYSSIGYVPHKQQLEFHRSRERFRVVTAGRRFGKSLSVARDATAKHLLRPNTLTWSIGPTYTLAEKEFRVIWMDLIVKKGFGKDRRVKKSYAIRSGDMHIEFPWGAKIEAKSAEHPDLLVGESLDHVILAEAAKHRKETWERYVRPSLSDKRGSADFVSTPEGRNWFYDLYLQGLNPDLPDYKSFRFPSWANNKVYPGGRKDPEILLLEKTMDPEWFKQEIGADFASFAGKIFPDWDEMTHTRAHTFNPNWKNYLCIDFGYTNPMALVEFQVSPSDQIFVWRVTYKKFKTVTDICREHMELPRPEGYHLDLAFADPADPEGVSVASQALGVYVMAPKDLKQAFTWLDGIMLMRQFMKPDREIRQDEFGTPYYEPSFFVDPRCTPVVKELANYRSKEPIKGQNVPELGQKIEDHTIDAMRYALLCIFKLGAVSSLADIYGMNVDTTPDLSREAAAARAVERDALLPVGAGSGSFTRMSDFYGDDDYMSDFDMDRGTFTRDMEF